MRLLIVLAGAESLLGAHTDIGQATIKILRVLLYAQQI
jgi:hypothetical protein